MKSALNKELLRNDGVLTTSGNYFYIQSASIVFIFTTMINQLFVCLLFNVKGTFSRKQLLNELFHLHQTSEHDVPWRLCPMNTNIHQTLTILINI